MIVDEQQVVGERLLRGEITWEQALEAITKEAAKPWQTNEWKEKRGPLIKDHCEQCGTDQSPMVLQHLHQPLSFTELRRLISNQLWVAHLKEHPLEVEEPTPGDRNACPRCSSTNIVQMKSGDKQWKCRFHSRGRCCGHEFFVPKTIQALTLKQTQERARALTAKSYEVKQAFHAKYGDYIATQAVLYSIAEHKRYMEMGDTVTFCKRCSFWWDIKGMQLCQKCRTNPHPIGLASCSACDTVNYKLCTTCGKHRHSIAYPTCFHCRPL